MTVEKYTKKKIIAHLPIRSGSERLKNKNILKINNKYLFTYALDELKNSICKNIYINSNSKIVEDYAKINNINFFKRENKLCTSETTSDDFNYDFIKKKKPDILVMINPVCPLITTNDINKALKFFLKNKYDCLISGTRILMQTFCKSQPININIKQKLQPSQNNENIFICNWAITIYDCKKFIDNYEKFGYAAFGKKRYLFPLSPHKSLKITTKEDFEIAKKCLEKKPLFKISNFLKSDNVKKITAIIPIKKKSERLENKNFLKINNKPLYYYILKSLSDSKLINEILVNSDAIDQKKKILRISKKIKFITRLKKHRPDDANFSEILKYTSKFANSDFILQTHVTNPLLTTKTINQFIETFFSLKEKNNNDLISLFSISNLELKKRIFDNKFSPVNFDINDLTYSTKDLKKNYYDNSICYIFDKNVLFNTNSRFAPKNFAKVLNSKETLDIDYYHEFEKAKSEIETKY